MLARFGRVGIGRKSLQEAVCFCRILHQAGFPVANLVALLLDAMINGSAHLAKGEHPLTEPKGLTSMRLYTIIHKASSAGRNWLGPVVLFCVSSPCSVVVAHTAELNPLGAHLARRSQAPEGVLWQLNVY